MAADFKLAFDSVNRSKILNDLILMGIPKKLVQLVGVTLAGSKATVRVDNIHTPTFPIYNGVRQGDALSPLIFNLTLEAIIRKKNTNSCIRR